MSTTSAGMGLSIGGMIEQDIASWLAPIFTSNALRTANSEAKRDIETGYRDASGNLRSGYNQGRSDVYGGRDASISSLERGYGGAESAQMPYYNAGNVGLQNLSEMARNGFSFNGNDLQNEPGYQFRFNEGQRAIQSGAAARGMVLSPATQKALAKYGQGLASDEYAAAYGRARDTYTTNWNANAGLAGMGQSAANQIGGYRTGLGTGKASVYTGAGNTLGSMAQGYGRNAADLNVNRANTLSDLAIQRGNINAGEWQGYANAAMGQGQHFQDIGGMVMGSGGGGSSGGSGGGMGSMDFNSLMNMFGGSGSGAAAGG